MCNDVIMITSDALERVRGWFTGRLPQDWQAEPAGISIDRDEIVVTLQLPDVPSGASEAETEEAREGRASAFREETREQRMAIAREAQRRYERTVSWGVRIGDHRELFTHLAAPTQTRPRPPPRPVLHPPGGPAPLRGPRQLGRADRRPPGALPPPGGPDHDPPAPASAAGARHPGRRRGGPLPRRRPRLVRPPGRPARGRLAHRAA